MDVTGQFFSFSRKKIVFLHFSSAYELSLKCITCCQASVCLSLEEHICLPLEHNVLYMHDPCNLLVIENKYKKKVYVV